MKIIIMTCKIFHIFIICFTLAALLNVANFFVCYYIYYTKDITEDGKDRRTTSEYDDDATPHKKWDIMLMCGNNSSDCPSRSSVESNSEESPEKLNSYYYRHDAVIRTTRICPKKPPGLGPVKMGEPLLELNVLEEFSSDIEPGGIFKPKQCVPRQSVAIIIPMQDVSRLWKNYIGTFLFYMHPFLMKQLSEYQIFVIVQGNPTEPYARGKLLNTGFLEAQKMRKHGWDCLIFHDPHLIPTDTRNMYRCSARPRRLVAATGQTKLFGGAVAIRPGYLNKINGFSNIDWYEGEDYINMYKRLKEWNYTIETNSPSIGNYITLHPVLHKIHSGRFDTSHETTPIYSIDGISSIWYRVVKIELKRLFTLIQVDFRIPD